MIYWTLLTLCSLPISLALSEPYPWAPPDYPPTTIENDGTKFNRYDVRKTLSYTTDRPTNINNIFLLVWVTTTNGNKYHLTTNSGMIGSDQLGAFLSFNDLQDRTGRGSSLLQPGSAANVLDWRAANQSIRAPQGGDGWTGTAFNMELSGIKLDMNMYPTGDNFYYGGNGGIQLFSRTSEFSARTVNVTNSTGEIADYSSAIPGWSWYWSNPTTRINGTISVDGQVEEIDFKESYALFERQWGDFFVGQGYYILWLYLETGEVLISWSMEPDYATGTSEIAFASIWHPNGLHENVPVGSNSIASDITSTESGRRYFNHFVLDLPAKNATFTFKKWVREAEISPVLPEQRDTFTTISESYGEGSGYWNGRQVKVQGHVEQLTRLIVG